MSKERVPEPNDAVTAMKTMDYKKAFQLQQKAVMERVVVVSIAITNGVFHYFNHKNNCSFSTLLCFYHVMYKREGNYV